MSSYGPPGRPYQGQPQDPYEQSSDPWGGHEHWDGEESPAHGDGYRQARHDQPWQDQPGYPEQGQGGYRPAQYSDPSYEPSYGDGSGYGAGYGGDPGRVGGSAYGDGPAYGAGPGYAASAYGGAPPPTGPAAEPAPGWDRPEPPGRGSNRMFVAFVVVLAVLVLAGGGGAFYLVNRDKEPAASPTTPAPGATDAGQPAGGASGTGQSPTPAPESSAEARFATKGQCLVNDGTDKDPKMRIVKCGGNTYEVVARFDGTTDYKGKCGKVQGYQFHYFFDSELDVLDFVLCLRKR